MWRIEDGTNSRLQKIDGALKITQNSELKVTSRMAPVTNMVVSSLKANIYLLRHIPNETDSQVIVEDIDPVSLEPIKISETLPGGPIWPGSIAVLENGNLLVVFGNHIHLLDNSLKSLISRELPYYVPYNGFVTIDDRYIATKNFGGTLPTFSPIQNTELPCQILIFDTKDLTIVASIDLDEPSVARLSSCDEDIYVVGISKFYKVRFDKANRSLTKIWATKYRNFEGQHYGWDCVIHNGYAWFLDNGENTHKYNGSLSGLGIAESPLHLIRIDLNTRQIDYVNIVDKPHGIVANPPILDTKRNIVVGFDSGNNVLKAFRCDTLEVLWEKDQAHASHMILYQISGELITCDNTDVVILDIQTGNELIRIDHQGLLQSVLFMMPGFNRDFYLTTFAAVSRIQVIEKPLKY